LVPKLLGLDDFEQNYDHLNFYKKIAFLPVFMFGLVFLCCPKIKCLVFGTNEFDKVLGVK